MLRVPTLLALYEHIDIYLSENVNIVGCHYCRVMHRLSFLTSIFVGSGFIPNTVDLRQNTAPLP